MKNCSTVRRSEPQENNPLACFLFFSSVHGVKQTPKERKEGRGRSFSALSVAATHGQLARGYRGGGGRLTVIVSSACGFSGRGPPAGAGGG